RPEAHCPRKRGLCPAGRAPPPTHLPDSRGSHANCAKLFPRMYLKRLADRLASAAEPPFRSRQVWDWAARGATSYEEMTNLPLDLRERLAGGGPLSSVAAVGGARAR